MTETLTLAPPELRPLVTDGKWNAVEQEPNFDIVLRCRREHDANGMPCSRWEYGYAIEGEWKGPVSQTQRDYAGAFMRHISRLIQEPNGFSPESLEANIAALAQRFQTELRATMAIYVNLTEYIVRTEGLHGAASVLGMKENKVKHLLKARGKMPTALPGKRTI